MKKMKSEQQSVDSKKLSLEDVPGLVQKVYTGVTWRMSLLAMLTLAEEKKYLKEENELRTEPY